MQTNTSANNSASTQQSIGSDAGSAVQPPLMQQIDLQLAINNMMMVLNSKEKEVLTRRFSLNTKPKETLDAIGKRFSITRERVRQIEGNALNKLRRTVHSSQLRFINQEAENVLAENGGVILESDLVAQILNKLGKENSEMEGNMIRLSLSVDTEIEKNSKNKTLFPSWRFVEIKLSDVEVITNAAYKLLKKRGEVSSSLWIASQILAMNLFKNKRPTERLIISCLNIDSRVHLGDNGWGLLEWRSINPKSIKDKAKIVLLKEGKPLHFIEIANRIGDVGFRKKQVTIQAVHNELIKYDDFVLVGRGIYGLIEWGLVSGSVSDVIADVLSRSKEPLPKYEIVKQVQELRDVKIGTISLNLQKNDLFMRVGRAMYVLKKKN